ncbi:MAG: oligosaccharide flippase family protein [Bacteroidota bacterium]
MLRRLFRQSSVYALTSVASKASGFILLAFYGDPEILSRADFGYLGALDATKMFALLVAGAGMSLGIIRFASTSALSEEEQAAVPATALVISAVAAAATVLAGWSLAAPLAGLIFDAGDGPQTLLAPAQQAEAVRWLAVYVGFRTISDVSYSVLRQRERPGAFVLLSSAEALVMVACVVAFLLDGQGLVGVMRGYALSAAIIASLATPLLLARVPRRVRWGLVRPLLVFGAPLILSGFAARFLNFGDRFLILHFLGAEQNAVYEWAARFGGVLNSLLVHSFALSFTVLGLKSLDASGTPELHRQAFRHIAVLGGWMTLGLGLFTGDVSRLLTDQDVFWDVGGLVILIAGGFAFQGLYYVVVNVLYAEGKTRAVALGVGLAAVANLVLNVALIPTLGIAGAASSTLLAYALLAVLTAHLAQRSTPVAYPWRALGLVTGLTAALWLVALPTGEWQTASRLAARIGVALAYLPALWLLGIYDRDDWQRALGMLRREHDGSTGGRADGEDVERVEPPPTKG